MKTKRWAVLGSKISDMRDLFPSPTQGQDSTNYICDLSRDRAFRLADIMYPSDQCPVYAPFFSALGCSMAMCLAGLGAAYGTAKAGIGISMSGIMKPDLVIRNSVPIVMAAVLAIYGLVVSVMIANRMQPETHLFTAFIHLGAGIAVGISALGAGFAIGITGDAGVRASSQQPRMFMGMMLIQIFSEVLGLYGMVVALLMLTRTTGVTC